LVFYAIIFPLKKIRRKLLRYYSVYFLLNLYQRGKAPDGKNDFEAKRCSPFCIVHFFINFFSYPDRKITFAVIKQTKSSEFVSVNLSGENVPRQELFPVFRG